MGCSTGGLCDSGCHTLEPSYCVCQTFYPYGEHQFLLFNHFLLSISGDSDFLSWAPALTITSPGNVAIIGLPPHTRTVWLLSLLVTAHTHQDQHIELEMGEIRSSSQGAVLTRKVKNLMSYLCLRLSSTSHK